VIEWTERPPEQAGAGELARATELVRSRGAVASLCVLRDGQVLLDRSFGCAPDSLFWIFSASKPFIALLVHLLAQRGELGLDDPVARHWPAFGRNGKETITVRHVLQHRSGLQSANGFVGDALAMTGWERSVRAIERATPRWPPGEVPAYQPIIFGFILGEIVRQVTGTELSGLLRKEFLGPLGLADTHLGLPDEHWPRHVPIRGRGLGGAATSRMVNRKATRRAVIPAAGISTTARDLATFYQALLNGGALGGVRILGEEAILEARRPSGGTEIDRTIRVPIRWSHGFQLGGAGRPLGTKSAPEAFGHNGSNCCIGWADPTRRLAFAYLTDRISGSEGARHLGKVADAVLAACR
jgi:CubicO group peptidase (beta-lactamase class C family)